MSTPNRLGGLIQPKGSAPRPADMPQRGEPAPAPTEAAKTAPAATEKEEKKRSLTLKLTEEQYQRLRAYGFRNELSHQKIIEKALMQHLDKEGA